MKTKKLPILNDPIYGFIGIDSPLIFKLIAHPYFQRLRRISQMGLSAIVFPGARHSRFEHVLGAMHLMSSAIDSLRKKSIPINPQEAEALKIAILLHDIGHGPFSHAMEKTIIQGVHHEKLSLAIMKHLNEVFDGQLSLAIQIFTDQYRRKFMHQLVSSQLDVDRLDYLKRDSFYTGAMEGNVNTQRIISMMTVVNDELVIEEKGLFSVEKFILARRMMYWQVYLHKTSLMAELLLEKCLARARKLVQGGNKLIASKELLYFLNTAQINITTPEVLFNFTRLDDIDIMFALKQWQDSSDKILSSFSKCLINRELLNIKITEFPFEEEEVLKQKINLIERGWDKEKAESFVFKGHISNQAYATKKDAICFLKSNGQVVSLDNISTLFIRDAFTDEETKYYLCAPKSKS